LEEARTKREKESSMAAQQNGSAVSAPVTPASTPTAPPPTGIREGMAVEWIREQLRGHGT